MIIEDIFHAYQEDNKELYNELYDFNKEFEAKVAKMIIINEMNKKYYPSENERRFANFLNSTYGSKGPTAKQITSFNFRNGYNLEKRFIYFFVNYGVFFL